jgi:hypothetical protein
MPYSADAGKQKIKDYGFISQNETRREKKLILKLCCFFIPIRINKIAK